MVGNAQCPWGFEECPYCTLKTNGLVTGGSFECLLLHRLTLTWEQSGFEGQPAPGHRPRFFPFRDELLRTHQYFCHPHLSLCTGALPHFVNHPKTVLSPMSRYHLPSKSSGWCQGHSTQRLSACWPLPKCLLVQLETTSRSSWST